jgi:hypothetical protein
LKGGINSERNNLMSPQTFGGTVNMNTLVEKDLLLPSQQLDKYITSTLAGQQ